MSILTIKNYFIVELSYIAYRYFLYAQNVLFIHINIRNSWHFGLVLLAPEESCDMFE